MWLVGSKPTRRSNLTMPTTSRFPCVLCHRKLVAIRVNEYFLHKWRHVPCVLTSSFISSLSSLSILNRGLQQRRRRSQRERPKSSGLRLAKQQLGTCITLFCTFLCRHCTSTIWKREHKTTTLFFFPWTSIQSFRIKLPPTNCQYLTNWTRWNKRDKVWWSATSLFKWRFRCCRRRCRWSSLIFEDVGQLLTTLILSVPS